MDPDPTGAVRSGPGLTCAMNSPTSNQKKSQTWGQDNQRPEPRKRSTTDRSKQSSQSEKQEKKFLARFWWPEKLPATRIGQGGCWQQQQRPANQAGTHLHNKRAQSTEVWDKKRSCQKPTSWICWPTAVENSIGGCRASHPTNPSGHHTGHAPPKEQPTGSRISAKKLSGRRERERDTGQWVLTAPEFWELVAWGT